MAKHLTRAEQRMVRRFIVEARRADPRASERELYAQLLAAYPELNPEHPGDSLRGVPFMKFRYYIRTLREEAKDRGLDIGDLDPEEVAPEEPQGAAAPLMPVAVTGSATAERMAEVDQLRVDLARLNLRRKDLIDQLRQIDGLLRQTEERFSQAVDRMRLQALEEIRDGDRQLAELDKVAIEAEVRVREPDSPAGAEAPDPEAALVLV